MLAASVKQLVMAHAEAMRMSGARSQSNAISIAITNLLHQLLICLNIYLDE